MRNVIRLPLVLVALSVLSGCASFDSHQGQVLEPDVGTAFADFTFVDSNGQAQQFRDHRADFTILAFTKCRGELHRPVSEELVRLARESQEPGPGAVNTAVFDVHWSEADCSHGEDCHLVDGARYLYSICDGRGALRLLYGADEKNQVFVIGPDGRIADKGSLADLDTLRSKFRGMLESHAAEERAAVSPDL